ncbi:MAG: phosphoribosylformylglycinamidine synthase subunit PurL [Thermoplasmata archaeon]|nr:phosphoribosylformylglycinamidine synthase subunit PurL [Thermoplasmata archaeon]
MSPPSGTLDGGQAPEVRTFPIQRATDRDLERIARDAGFGFTPEELGRIRAHYRTAVRDPTDVELAGLSQSWSEHCSYKSSKLWLRRGFLGLAPKARVLGTGDAGVLRFEDGFAYALRIESHNHPSAVEPYGGAATGIGGILRDVLAVGAKPIALADPLFFGPLDATPSEIPSGGHSPRYVMAGVVAGIRDYGNRVGVPTVAGSVSFDPAYAGNPLVNVGCIGFLPSHRLRPNRAQAPGNHLVLVGGLTARDGIGGVAFASQELDATSAERSRGQVQLGNPIMKEPLIHACLEAFDRELVESVKDLGGGGLATASGELAHAGGLGLVVHLDRVPLREADLKPWEIWISESQERMLLEVRPERVRPLLEIFRRYDVPASEIGRIASGHQESIYFGGRIVGDLPLAFRVDPPLLLRPRAKRARTARRPPKVPDGDLAGLFERLILSPETNSREALLRVYDHEVQGRVVVKPLHGRPETPSHGDASVLVPRPESAVALAVSVASQPWACREAPRAGAVWTVEEAARNLYAVGARPDAFTNCLNFGNPEDPKVLDDFVEVVRGLADGARALGFAIPSGNVSFYNGGQGSGIPPTPVLMATGLLDDFRYAVTSDLKEAGNPLYLVGRSSANLGGSLFARQAKRTGLALPRVDPKALRALGETLLRAGRRGLVRAAHDVSDGGLATTLFEMAAGGNCGFRVDLAATGLSGAGLALAAEGGSRWVVEVPLASASDFERAFRGRPFVRFGEVRPDLWGTLLWRSKERARIDLGALYPRWRAGPIS